jgi:hypothetical protein
VIRRSPCEQYIKYLLLHPDAYGDQAVEDILRAQHLDFVSQRYISRLRSRLQPPKQFKPYNRLHAESARFLTRERVYYLFHPDEAMEQANAILHSPRGKECIETHLIAQDTPAFVLHGLHRLGLRASLKAVERYRFHYWNLMLVDDTELRALLHLRAEYVSPMEDDQDPQLRMAMKKASFRDPRRMMSAMVSSPMAALLNMVRQGLVPSELELTRLANSVRVTALVRAAEAALLGAPSSAAEARDYSTVVQNMTSVVAELGSPDEDLQKDLQKLALALEESEVPTIKQLGGEHTVDLQPLKEVIDVDGGEVRSAG